MFFISVFTIARDTRNLEVDKKYRWGWLIFILIGSIFLDFLGIFLVLISYGVWRTFLVRSRS
ncbi:hypothetical protein C9439_02770 [archaeon SCG-AAA382B04]|nr:hypothetical protein C9439_02770 [archaeon SCG-AAA382B04]